MKALAIAKNTFRETYRDRVQWILAFYVILLLGGTLILTPLSMGEGYRITRDLGLAGISLVGMVLIALVGGGLIHKEIERRTVLSVMSKPIKRSQFLLGKFMGLLAMVTLVFAGMVLFFGAVLWATEGSLEKAVLMAALLTYGQLMILTALVVAFSAFVVSPVLSGLFVFMTFVLGNFSEDLLRFAEKAPTETMAWLSRTSYLFLPHFHVFNWRAEAAYSVSPEPGQVLWAVLYAVLYTATILALGAAMFQRRELR